MLERLPPLLREIRPDVLLVQGDTMTSFAAAFAAYLERIPSGHVEAGLRTGDRYQPFPEEMNRVLTTRLADLHFAPTAHARAALLNEGVPPRTCTSPATPSSTRCSRPSARLQLPRPRSPRSTRARRLVLVTTHRRESFGAPLRAPAPPFASWRPLPDLQFVLPVHPNPEVKATVERLLCDVPGMHLIEPVDYVEFVHLMNRAYLVLTDSGGVQEEAPSLGKPVLVLREVTERPEGVEAGTAVVVGTDRDRIVESPASCSPRAAAYERMANAVNPYGDGLASGRIVAALEERFG